MREHVPSVLVATLSAAFGVSLLQVTGALATMISSARGMSGSGMVAFMLALVGGVFIVIAVYVGAIVTANTFATIIAGRTRTIALLRLIGATAASQRRAVAREGLLVGVTGSVLGFAVGTAVTFGLISVAVSADFVPDLAYDYVPPVIALPLATDHVAYLSMPMFHSNAIIAGWGPALASGTTIALARRFTASGFLDDIRRFGATYANYVGKPLTYIMATPERPTTPTTRCGSCSATRPTSATSRSSAVGSAAWWWTPTPPPRTPWSSSAPRTCRPAASAAQLDGVKVLDPETMAETIDADFGPDGELLNADAATGELVNTQFGGGGASGGW